MHTDSVQCNGRPEDSAPECCAILCIGVRVARVHQQSLWQTEDGIFSIHIAAGYKAARVGGARSTQGLAAMADGP